MPEDKPMEVQEDYMTWKRNCDWLVIVRLMRLADGGDEATLKRLKDDYQLDYDPETKKTTEAIRKEIDVTMYQNEQILMTR